MRLKANACFLLFLFISSLVSAAQTNSLGPVAPGVWRVGNIQQVALTESSGLLESRRRPGVYWTHNDTFDPNFLFAINQRGEHLGAFEVKGVELIDWEATAMDEHGYLYLADIGTNGLVRTYSAIHRVAEPDPDNRSGPARVEKTWFVRMPTPRVEAESLFVLAGYAYVLTKERENGQVQMFRFSLADNSDFITMDFVASVPVPGDLGDVALSSDLTRLAYVTEQGVAVDFINGDATSAGRVPRRFTPYASSLMEGGTFTDNGILVTSETPEILLFNSAELAGAPIITTGLSNQVAFAGRTVVFVVEADAIPAPSYEWRFNGQLLTGQTSPTLTLTNLSLADGGTYEVTVRNAAGVARSSAVLTVKEQVVQLRVTEVMSSEATPDTADWWELTNLGNDPVNLFGWRFNDSVGGLADAYVITNRISISPGESIVFVERLTPEDFRAWWGEANFAASMQIVSYSGAQLSFRAAGDSLQLWDSVTTNPDATIERVDFGQADTGVSFGYDPVTGLFGAKSQLGVNGAFQAEVGPDIGSPGRIGGVVLQSRTTGSLLQLTIGGSPNERYRLESSEDLQTWNAEETADGATVLEKPASGFRRFYRVRTER